MATQLACVVGLLLASVQAFAEVASTPSLASHALAGLDRASLPQRSNMTLAADAGYGYTPALPDETGAHHGAVGSLAFGLPLTDWLCASVQLRGRYDSHPDDARGADDSLSGLPALRLRAFDSHDHLSFGAELRADFPGRQAPSIDIGSTTIAAVAMVAHQAPDSPLSLVINAGYRLDNSASSAPDLARLRQGDRVALGLSDYDAALLALGGQYRIGNGALLAELSADFLLGAPTQATSPKRASVGYWHQLQESIQARLVATTNLAPAPDVDPDSPLIAVEPAALVTLGVRYTFTESTQQQRTADPPPAVDESAGEQPEAPPPSLSNTKVRGKITDSEGRPLAQVDVIIEASGERRTTTTDASGVYQFDSVPFGPATLRASTVDYEPSSTSVEMGGDGSVVEVAPLTMQLQSLGAQIQGLVQSFKGEPIAATVAITPGGARHQAGADGRFSIDLSPGAYTVAISAPGFVSQTHRVTLKQKAVIVVNADLRQK